MTTPLPARSVPRIDAVNASSGTFARSMTTASSAVFKSNATSAVRGCNSRGNDHCVDSAIDFRCRCGNCGRDRLDVTPSAGSKFGDPFGRGLTVTHKKDYCPLDGHSQLVGTAGHRPESLIIPAG